MPWPGIGALALVVLAISGILMLVSRLGGWSKLFATARGTLRQRLHVDIGRIAVLGLMLSALTGVYMSLVSFGLISDGTAGLGLSFPPAGSGTTPAAISELSALKSISLTDLRELVFPSPTDAADVFTVTTDRARAMSTSRPARCCSSRPTILARPSTRRSTRSIPARASGGLGWCWASRPSPCR